MGTTMTVAEVLGLIAKLSLAIKDAHEKGDTHIDVGAVTDAHKAAEKSAHDAAEQRLHERFDKGGTP